MVGTVNQSSFQTNYWVACQSTFFDCFLQTFFNCWEEVLRNCATEYFFFEYEVAYGWLEFDPNVTELTMTAGLFLMTTLNFYFLADSFAVSNARLFQSNFYAEFIFQFGQNNFQMLIAQTGEDLLFGFYVVFVGNGWIFFQNSLDSSSDLGFVCFVFGFDCFGEARCWHSVLLETNLEFRIAERVAAESSSQFGYSTDITSGDVSGVFLFFTTEVNDFAQTFRLTGTYVDWVGVCAQFTGNNFHVRKFAYEWVSNGFEHVSSQRSFVGAFYFYHFTVHVLSNFGAFFPWGWEQVNDCVHNHINTFQSDVGTTEDRRNCAVIYAIVYAFDDFIAGELFTGEVFLEQFFVGFCNCFGNSSLQTFQTVAHIRHSHFRRFTFFVVFVCFLVDQVDIALYFVIFAVRNNDWADRRTELSFQCFQNFIEVAVFNIQFGYEEHGSFLLFFSQTVCFFGTNGNAVFTGNCDQYRFCRTDTFVQACFKVEQTRSVQQVDFGGAPCEWCYGGRHGSLSLNGFRIVVANGVAFCYFAQTLSCAGFVEHSFSQRSFTGVRVTSQYHVTNLSCKILFHRESPLSNIAGFGTVLRDAAYIIESDMSKYKNFTHLFFRLLFNYNKLPLLLQGLFSETMPIGSKK